MSFRSSTARPIVNPLEIVDPFTPSSAEVLTNKDLSSPTNETIASGLWSGNKTNAVMVKAAANPTAGQVLTASAPGLASWVTPSVTASNSVALTNKDMTSSTNDLVAIGLWSGGKTNTVSVSGATNPTAGQVLTATSGTAATWQTPATTAGLLGTSTFIVSGTTTPSGVRMLIGTFTLPAGEGSWYVQAFVSGNSGVAHAFNCHNVATTGSGVMLMGTDITDNYGGVPGLISGDPRIGATGVPYQLALYAADNALTINWRATVVCVFAPV